jgi:hypothetical protein
MAEGRTEQKPGAASQDRKPTPDVQVHPDEVARRELVEWCKAHGLPVPPERRGRR